MKFVDSNKMHCSKFNALQTTYLVTISKALITVTHHWLWGYLFLHHKLAAAFHVFLKCEKSQLGMHFTNHYVVIFLVFILSEAFTFDVKKLRDWHRKISDQNYNCQFSDRTDLELHGLQVLQVVDCDDPLAIYRYDFKVS